MQSLKNIVINGLMVIGLSFGLMMSSVASNDFYWYETQAEQGNVSSQTMIGIMYLNGEGVSKDLQQSFIWFEKAAKQGDSVAQTNIGMMYDLGQGVRQDKKKQKNGSKNQLIRMNL